NKATAHGTLPAKQAVPAGKLSGLPAPDGGAPAGGTRALPAAGPETAPTGDKDAGTVTSDSVVSNEGEAVFTIGAEPKLALVKTGHFNDENGNRYADADETVTYEFRVANKGNVAVDDVVPVDAGPVFNGHAGAGKLSPFTPASAAIEPGKERVFTATYQLAQADIDTAAAVEKGVVNHARAKGKYTGSGPGDGPPALVGQNTVDTPASVVEVESEEVVSVLALPAAYGNHDVTFTKQAGVRQIRRGEKAPFTIKLVNNNNDTIGGVSVTDMVPSGFRYVDGSATVNTVATVPALAGRAVRFDNLQLGPRQELVIRLQLRALSTAEPGKHTNRARTYDNDGKYLAGEASASIEIMVDPVFDCGDVIGRVFDDVNNNGYQDEGEPGLPGVRVATVKGLLVTTDKYGRFHVACADLPEKRIGSNFLMKLDTRTLPTGYGLTTENPKVIRLTAGKMSKLNFGASIGHVVRLDLTDGAFETGGIVLRDEWSRGLDQLIGVLKQQPSTLRIFYLVSVAKKLAEERLKAVEEDVLERWKMSGSDYELTIETRTEAGQ
ncbi:MAG: DUF7507 domain-containing protein, partial [Phyllobacterium sp.]